MSHMLKPKQRSKWNSKKHIVIGALISFQHPIGQSTTTVETDNFEQHTQLRRFATSGGRTNQRLCVCFQQRQANNNKGWLYEYNTYLIQAQSICTFLLGFS